MPDQDGDQTGGGAETSGPPRTEKERGVLPYTNDILAGVWTLFAVGASAYLFTKNGSLPAWLQVADFVSIASTSYWAYGRGAFRAVGGFFREVIS